MTTGVDTVRGLRYKLRMMGVTIDGAAQIYGDNMSVIENTSKPESTLNKKCNSVCYHAVTESVVMGETLTACIPGAKNPADLMTKVLSGIKCQYLLKNHLTTYMIMACITIKSVNKCICLNMFKSNS
ncbi:hypothetical protein ACHAXS_000140 [Conticribra weissflogii]